MKDTETFYHSFMYSLASLLSRIYPLPAMHSAAVSTFLSVGSMYWSDCCLEVKNRFYNIRGWLGRFCVEIFIFLLF